MISIIIPTLNEEKYLTETLATLCDGMGKLSYEIIISDGRSTDATVMIAKKYSARVVLYKEKKRQTIAQARNMGADVARGDYLVFMDADVIVPNAADFFKKALKLFMADSKLNAVCVSLAVTPELATVADRFFYALINWFHGVMNNILHHGVASGEFQMIRASEFKAVGGFNENLVAAEDYELFGRLARCGKTRMVSSLRVWHSGRRVHTLGWSRLLIVWFTNWVSMILFKRAVSKVWEPIR